MTTSEEIVAAAKALPEETRLQIVDMLLESVYASNGEIDEAWARVILRRGREIERCPSGKGFRGREFARGRWRKPFRRARC